jgi:hypothetical protein
LSQIGLITKFPPFTGTARLVERRGIIRANDGNDRRRIDAFANELELLVLKLIVKPVRGPCCQAVVTT